MLEQLFGSKTRVRLLRLFFENPEKTFYVREMARHVSSQINAVRRELLNMQRAGIVEVVDNPPHTMAPEDARLYARCTWYRLREDCFFHDELRALVAKSRAMGEKSMTDEIVKAFEQIELFLLTGHFTQDDEVPTDMLLVGEVDQKRLSRLIRKFEHEFSRPIRYTLMSPREYHERQQIVDKFLFSLFQAPHVVVVGESIPVIH